MAKAKIGIALGSGSARGWSHIGILEALADAGIHPDIVCGCSIGAMVGAACISGKLDPLKDWVLSLNWSEIARLLGIGFSDGGLVDGDVFSHIMTRLEIDAPIESYDTPFAAIATDLATGREIWLREGPIHKAARASMAMPGVFTPAKHGKDWLLDGGLVNPVPVSVCRALGADIIIAVNLNSDLLKKRRGSHGKHHEQLSKDMEPSKLEALLQKVPAGFRHSISQMVPELVSAPSPAPGYFDVLANAINIMQDHITRSRLAGEPPDVMLHPRLSHMGLFDYQNAAEAIREGRKCVARALPDLETLVR